MKILVSHCFLGEPCRYDGTGCLDRQVIELHGAGHELIPVCPEQLGGLATPREPAERRGQSVWNRKGEDVTGAFCRGAGEALRLAQLYGCTLALLKERSPSCGSGNIYDGSFTGTVTDGDGVTAELLKKNGIRVVGEGDAEELCRILGGKRE